VCLVILPMALLAAFAATFEDFSAVTRPPQTQGVLQHPARSLRAADSEARAEPSSVRDTAESCLTNADPDSPSEKSLTAQASGAVSNHFGSGAIPCHLQSLILREPALTLERPPRA
jgi:hypothetical protein